MKNKIIFFKKEIIIYLEKQLYTVMPDWDPAEMIGIKPKALAFSLYQELITDFIWAKK